MSHPARRSRWSGFAASTALIVEDHRGKHRFGHQLAADLGAPLEFPHIAAVALLGDMDVEAVAGHDRAAEAGVVDAHEIDQLALGVLAERMDDEHGGGLRHRLDDQHPGHDRPAREMALKERLVDRDILDPGGPNIRHRIDDLVDHQKRVAMRDHFHDPLNVDLGGLLVRAGRIDHRPSFFSARRCSSADCLNQFANGTAGKPPTVAPASTSRITPAFAAMRAPLPMFRWPAKPACPPAMTKSPSFVLPEMPTWETRMQPRPTTTLCPICTRLSIIVPKPITVSCPDPRSIVVLAPISTSSPITTRPSCGTLTGPPASGAKPKPAWPMRTPGCSTTRAPIRQWLSVTLAPIRQSSPSSTAGPTTVFGPIWHRAPSRASASITTWAPMSQSSGTVAVGSMTAEAARRARTSFAG